MITGTYCLRWTGNHYRLTCHLVPDGKQVGFSFGMLVVRFRLCTSSKCLINQLASCIA
jgi:hypothetical protein